MFCQDCGRELSAESKFCSACGSRTDLASAISRQAPAISKRLRTKSQKLIPLSITSVVVIFIGLLFLFLPFRRTEKTKVSGAMLGAGPQRTNAFDSLLPLGPPRERWRFNSTTGMPSPAVVYAGMVYFGASDGHLFAVHASTGKHVWKFKTGGQIPAAPAVENDVVHVKTGTEKWRYKAGNEIDSSPAVVAATAYFTCLNDRLYAIDISTGGEKWNFKRHESVTGSHPAVSEGTVYYGGGVNYLYAVDAKNTISHVL